MVICIMWNGLGDWGQGKKKRPHKSLFRAGEKNIFVKALKGRKTPAQI